jgi:hypothetical protein
MIISIGRKKYTATTNNGRKLHTNDILEANRFLFGLQPGQTLDDFEYPGPGGRIRHNDSGNDISGIGVDGGGVSFGCAECGAKYAKEHRLTKAGTFTQCPDESCPGDQ